MEPDRNRLHPAVLRSVVDLMRRGIFDDLTTDDLADHAGYSRFHFSRLFTGATGVAPGRFLSALRMDAAKRLLLTDTAAVIDVAATVGFDSLSSFSRRFDAMVGVPPGRFRRLADTLGDHTLAPFRMADDREPTVTIRPHLGEASSPNRSMALWIGWFPQPVPFGLPAAGMLATTVDEVRLPLSPGNPWLLSVALPLHADADEQLAPTQPLVARAPGPVRQPMSIDLHYGRSPVPGPPMLPALPSLSPIAKTARSDKGR